VLASAVASRGVVAEAERPLREIGQALFAALLGSGDITGRYRASAALAAGQEQGLRVVLRIDTPALAGLPWEAMYDAVAGGCVCWRDPLVRHVPVPSPLPPLTVQSPLRILGIVSPRGLGLLDTDREKEQLTRALARPCADGLIEIHWAAEATWAAGHLAGTVCGLLRRLTRFRGSIKRGHVPAPAGRGPRRSGRHAPATPA
jgi:hypothetical protein